MIAAVKRRFFPVDPVMPGYRQPKNPRWIKFRNVTAISALVLVGLFYGLFSAIFPVFLYMYLALPILIVAALVIWALPDTGRFPERTIETLFWLFLCAQLVWPNYLAISLPGLPWITVNRLVTAPLAIVFLVSLSVSKRLRTRIADVLRASPIVSRCFLGFMALQILTLPLSSTLAASLNQFIDFQVQCNLVFFVALWLFTKDGRAQKFFTLYPCLIILLMVIAVFEWRAGGVLWADSIPSFLKIGDESVERTLSGSARAATGIYRVQSVFTTSLDFAEVLAWSTPFFLYWALFAQRMFTRLTCVAVFPALFWIIRSTDSRLGVVGFFMTFIVFVGIYGIRRWLRDPRGIMGPAITLGYPFAASLFFVATLVSARLGAMIYGNGAQAASNEGRAAQWALLWPKLGQWPFGYGTGRGAETIGMYNQVGILTIDSYYIVLLVEYGVIGFLMWCVMLFGTAAQSAKFSYREDGPEARMLIALAAYTIVYFVIKAVLASDHSNGIGYMVLGMTLATIWRVGQRTKDQQTATD